MKKKKYTEEKARQMISKNGGSVGAKTVNVRLPGIKVLGAIDYLVNYHGYRFSR